jgi:hypothetical protein
LVSICEKCGKRAGGSGKNVSHRLASRFKRRVKHEFNKGDVRIVLTTCAPMTGWLSRFHRPHRGLRPISWSSISMI